MFSCVMITGAAGGLGRSFAVECAARGWDLLITDRAEEPLADLAAALSRHYRVRVHYAPCDLTDATAREGFYDRMHADNIQPWMLLNVAGLDYEGPFFEIKRTSLLQIVRVNVEATLATTHAVVALRDRSRPFRLLTVGSLAGYFPMPLKATYAASKAFLHSLSLAMREELRSIGGSATILTPAGMATTPNAIRGIEAQGIAGSLTTIEVTRVVSLALDATLRGKARVVPGLLNRVARVLGLIVPATVIAAAIGRRWRSTGGSLLLVDDYEKRMQ
jgi:short-subunit dehydrogenase